MFKTRQLHGIFTEQDQAHVSLSFSEGLLNAAWLSFRIHCAMYCDGFLNLFGLESESQSSVRCKIFFSVYWNDLNLNHWKILVQVSFQ